MIRAELYSHLAAVLRRLEDQTTTDDPERAARFLVRLIQGVGMRHFDGVHLEEDPPEREELVEDLSRLALIYLGVEP